MPKTLIVNKSRLRTDQFQVSEYSCVIGKPRWPPHGICGIAVSFLLAQLIIRFYLAISLIIHSSLALAMSFIIHSCLAVPILYLHPILWNLPNDSFRLFSTIQILSIILQQHPSASHNIGKPAVATTQRSDGNTATAPIRRKTPSCHFYSVFWIKKSQCCDEAACWELDLAEDFTASFFPLK